MTDFESKLSKGTIPAYFMNKYKKEYGPLVYQVLAVRNLQEGTIRLKASHNTYSNNILINSQISDGIVENGMAMYIGTAKPEGLESYAIIELMKHELVLGSELGFTGRIQFPIYWSYPNI